MIAPDFSKLRPQKILVGAPHNEIKNYGFDKWMARVSNLTYPLYDILVADNSKTFLNKKKIMDAGLNAVHIKPHKKSNQQYIAESFEFLRKRTLKNGYDYLMIIETDIYPPHDIIERLLVHQKLVVSGSYFIGHGNKSHLMIQEVEETGESMRNTINYTGGQDIVFVDGTLKKVYACGTGCMLIHKSVLKQIEFKFIEGVNQHPDTFLAADLYMLGIHQFLDTSILCEHDNMKWTSVADVR